MNVKEVANLLKKHTGKTLIEWSVKHGYKPDTVRATIRRWGKRIYGHPGGLSAEIALNLSLEIGKEISPVLRKHIKLMLLESKTDSNK